MMSGVPEYGSFVIFYFGKSFQTLFITSSNDYFNIIFAHNRKYLLKFGYIL
jgi:hypothetical protein